MNFVFIKLLLSFFVVIAATTVGRADDVTTWCGNGCSSEQDGPHCTDWKPGAAGQSCQAKAICSNGCTVWPVERNAGVDALRITPERARKLVGARTYNAKRPPTLRR